MDNIKYCKDFGKLLREARQQEGINQNELSEAVGISAQMVSAYENGIRKPSVEVAAALAGKLGVSLDFLCGVEVNPKKRFLYMPFSEMLIYLSKITEKLNCSCAIHEVQLSEEEYYDVNNGDDFETITKEKVAVFYIKNHEMTEFVGNWIKMYSLYKDKVISKDILETWYNGEIEKYNSASKHCGDQIPEFPVIKNSREIPFFGFDIEEGDTNAHN